jgi:hypothetical protein
MFVQVFEAEISDVEGWARQCAIWRAEIKPKTTGFQGYTSGVTTDGYMITMARFTSADAAQIDSGIAEQGEWFEATSQATFAGEVSFHDCNQVDVLLDGPTTEAGFVQIIRGRAIDEQVMRSKLKEIEADLKAARPDVLGGLVAWHGDGTFTQAVFFASESDARRGEGADEAASLQEEFLSLIDGEPTFYDFPHPDLV